MPTNNGNTRYHAEVKVMLQGRDVRINVFADTLPEIFRDLGTIVQQCPTAWVPPTDAGRQLAAAGLASPKPTPSPQPAAKAKPTPELTSTEPPMCVHCGDWSNMELIEFPDKRTGQTKRAWKCQACNKWHFPDRK